MSNENSEVNEMEDVTLDEQDFQLDEREVHDTPSYRFAATAVRSHPKAKNFRVSQGTGKTAHLSVIHHKDDEDGGESITVHHDPKTNKIHLRHEHGQTTSNKKSYSDHGEARKAVHKIMGEEFNHIEEGTMAADSLKPAARSVADPKSKIEVIQHVIGHMHAMKKEDLTKWFHDAMNLIGKEASHLPASANEKGNEASIRMKPSYATGKGGASANDPMPKLSVKEDVEEMFNGEELTEEFKEKASTLFEAAVNARITLEVARLEEEFETSLNESVSELMEEVTTKVDTYLDYVVENWMKENEVAVESTLRNELVSDFIDGMKGLFAEHYIDVPEDKVDVLESLAEKVEELEEKQNALIAENVELKKAFIEVEKENVLDSMMEGLALSQQEKFKALSEGIDFDGDLGTYQKKLSIIKETYFGADKKVASSNIEEETFEGEVNSTTVVTDPSVNRYVQAISRSTKR